MTTTLKTLGAIVLLSIGVVGFVSLAGTEPLRFGAHAEPDQAGWGRLAYGFLVTLVGVFLGSAFRELRRMQGKGRRSIRPLPFAGRVFRLIDFWMGICAAPLVYGLLLRNIGGGGDAGLTVLALENGFCCTLIASQLVSGPGQSDLEGEEDLAAAS